MGVALGIGTNTLESRSLFGDGRGQSAQVEKYELLRTYLVHSSPRQGFATRDSQLPSATVLVLWEKMVAYWNTVSMFYCFNCLSSHDPNFNRIRTPAKSSARSRI